MDCSHQEATRGSLSLRCCWGFSFGTRQAAVTIPLSTRQQPLGCHLTRGYLLVHSLGSWCVVRSVASSSPPHGLPAVSTLKERSQLFVEGNASESQLNEWPIGKENVSQSPADTGGRTQLSIERVFARHSNKVTLLTYCPALDACLSAEQQPASKGGGLQAFCRIWSPYTLRELALIQLPSPHDVTAAHFSDDGHVVLLLLADPQHSLAIYMGVPAALEKDRNAYADSTASDGTPVLRPAHVVPTTRSLLNGLSLEPAAQRRAHPRFRGAHTVCNLAGKRGHELQRSTCCRGGGATKHTKSGSVPAIRFATFGLGHLRVWHLSCERDSQLPSYRSLCVSRVAAADSGHSAVPEVTASSFLPSGDLIAALSDRRLVLFRGFSPVRSILLSSCSSRILLLQPLQRSLLLLVAQEGLVQLLPLASLTSPSQVRQTVSGPPATSPGETEAPKREHFPHYAKRGDLTLHRSPYGSARLRKERRPTSCTSTRRRATARLQSAGSATPTLVPPFATGSLDAPPRTPRSTYGDSVGRGYAARNRRYRHLASAGSQRSALLRNSSKGVRSRASSTDSQASTRSSTGVSLVHQEREQRRPSPREAGPARKGKQAASTSWLQPKRNLTTQEVATRCMRKGELQEEGSLWWPLHSSQVVALHWSEPTLLLCTRTQIVAVDSSNLSTEASKVLQERPLGNIDVAALLCLPRLPVATAHSKSTTDLCIQSDQDTEQHASRGDSRMNILVAGGRCCVGGELRLWELRASEQSTPPFYFKAPVTAVAAGLVEDGAFGVVAVGTEDGHLILLIVHRHTAGQLERPVVVWDRQISPRSITALSINRKGSLLAAGSTSGQIDCFRLLVSARKNGPWSADQCVQGGFVGNVNGFRHSNEAAKSSNVMVELVLQAILHVPFSTPPKILKFGQTPDTEEHLLVAGANAPACVYSIPEGRVLSGSVFVGESTDAFTPLFIPVPVALGPKNAASPWHSFLELLHQKQSFEESVGLRASDQM
ncbi:hypothetical protein Emed_003969 [Eimeria media]